MNVCMTRHNADGLLAICEASVVSGERNLCFIVVVNQ